ncbi:MAG TPA: inositol monophosphatase family protein, partial [Actinomycetota bacterium]
TLGVVFDTTRRHLFTGVRGRGARRDGMPIAASDRSDLSTAVVATGFSYRPERRAVQAKALPLLLPRIANIRCDGSAALDLCAVACGEVDAYFESEVALWDVAGGRVIAEEAGATVLVRETNGVTSVMAAAPALAGSLLDLLTEAGAAPTTP